MKKILTLAAIAAIAFAAFTGCKKSSSSSSSTYNVKATINGAPFSLNYAYFYDTLGVLNIAGLNFTSSTTTGFPGMTIGINNCPIGKTGTFNIDSAGVVALVALDSSLTVALSTNVPSVGPPPNYNITYGSGSVTITSFTSTTIVGTFNVTFPDGTTATNGSFTASNTIK